MIKGKGLLVVLVSVLFIFSVNLVSAVECGSIPTNGCVVTRDTTFQTGVYNLSNGISIGADNIVLDCNGAILNGIGFLDNGISIIRVKNVKVKNCIVTNYSFPFYLENTNHSEIVNNKMKYVRWGVFTWLSNYNNISNNYINHSDTMGMQIGSSSYNIINNNSIYYIGGTTSGTGEIGIYLVNDWRTPNIPSSYNVLSNNEIAYVRQVGIYVQEVSNNDFINNRIHDNNWSAIRFHSSSFSNIIGNNISHNNGVGVWLSGSDYNVTYNNFWNNSGKHLDGSSTSAVYNWWGTINELEIQSKIAMGIEYDPWLCEPYPTNKTSPCLSGDVNKDCKVDISDLASVGLAYGSKPGDSNWNENADVKIDGKVDIFDLASVGLNYGKEC